METFKDSYNLTKVARLPDDLIRLGNVRVTNGTGHTQDYLFLLDKFEIDQKLITADYESLLKQSLDTGNMIVMNYTFMLILP